MTDKKTTEIVSEIFELLNPLSSDERHRVIQASLTLLGETAAHVSPMSSHQTGGTEIDATDASSISSRARIWMKQYGIAVEDLQQVFQLDAGSTEVIAGEIPGKNRKEKTYNAYVLTGIATLLSNGNASFDDKSARALCERFGCYDRANHSSTMKDRGSEFTGTKDSGWSLTAPGLKRGAALVKEMTKT
jgi:hypothetical protein